MAKLRIAEIFTSIQGEGIWVGTPSTFIRVSGCNLRCGWCDTPYASWEPEGPMMEITEIVDRVHDLGINHVVITGGEPMLFEPVIQLCESLSQPERSLTIETAGTVFRELPCDLMSISPKLANSTPSLDSIGRDWIERHDSTRSDLGPLRQLIKRYPYQLKFVVNPESGDDIAEIKQVLADIGGLGPSNVLLMAEGRDSETLHRRERMLVPICMQEGWRLSSRLQIDLFGDTRGT